jgi:glycosyltransferase involved in cell wall biosynthesis
MICQENSGQSVARNNAIKQAVGAYICFADSYDYIEPNYMSTMYKQAEEKDADMVFCAFRSVDEEGRCLKNIYESGIKPNTVCTRDENRELFLIQNAVWNKLYRREIVTNNHLEFVKGVWAEDLRFNKKYLLMADKCVYCEEVLYNYLQRGGSTLSAMKPERNLQILEAFEDIDEFYTAKGQKEKYAQEIEFVAIDHIYISTLVRLIRANERECLSVIREAFLKRYPNYKENKYIVLLEKNRRIIYELLNRRLYGIIKLIFLIKSI